MAPQTADQDSTPQVVYESVQEESKSDIVAALSAAESNQAQAEIDMEQVVAKKRQMSAMDQQIKDLETIA